MVFPYPLFKKKAKFVPQLTKKYIPKSYNVAFEKVGKEHIRFMEIGGVRTYPFHNYINAF